MRVYALVEVEGRGTALRPAPDGFRGEVTVLDIEGNLFYAGARSLEGALPRVAPGSGPVVVLRLRGRDRIGATLVKVLEWYAAQIRDAGAGSTSAAWTPGWPSRSSATDSSAPRT